MAKVIRRTFFGVGRDKRFRVIPLGDVHIGAAACDEESLARIVKRIKEDEDCWWIGMGDYADFINLSDKRFDPNTLADWITVKQMGDLAAAQRDRYLDFVKPIAHKCLAMVKGNHEDSIARRYERDIYLEIVSNVKQMGGIPQEQHLGLGYYGWLRLSFYRNKEGKRKEGNSNVDINLHHGFVGGRLAGAKALNMQRWLWNHDADIVVFGHSHNTAAQSEAVESLDMGDNIVLRTRKGCYSGTFLRTNNPNGGNSYSEKKGYFPLPVGGCEIILQPRHSSKYDRIKIIT